jgi:hypothetical protein
VQAGSHTQPESVHTVSMLRFVQAVAVPPHLLPTQLQPLTLVQAAELVSVEHLVGVPAQLLVGWHPLAAEHCCADSVAHDVAAPLQTGAPPAPALAIEPAEPPVDAPPEPACPVVPPAPPPGEAPAPPAVLVAPPGMLMAPAPASPALLVLPPLSFATAPAPAAPAASLLEAPASPAAPGELKSLLEPPQLTLTERTHGTSHSQEDLFMPMGGDGQHDFIIWAVHNFSQGAPHTL